MMRKLLLIFIALLVLAGTCLGNSPASNPAQNIDLSKLPIYFLPNKGQIPDSDIQYYTPFGGLKFYFGPNKVIYELKDKDKNNSYSIDLRFLNSNSNPKIEGQNVLSPSFNFYQGSDPKKYIKNLKPFEKVIYRDIYPGIDAAYFSKEGNLKSEYIVNPGADYQKIKLQYRDIKKLEVDQKGDLIIYTSHGKLTETKPYTYQNINGRIVEVESNFVLINRNTFAFSLKKYNPNFTLVIDPVISYFSYLGGSGGSDYGQYIKVDSSGNIYIAGTTWSSDFPTNKTVSGSHSYLFAMKFDSSFNLIYSVRFEFSKDVPAAMGSQYPEYYNDVLNGMAVDGSQNLYVVGRTNGPRMVSGGEPSDWELYRSKGIQAYVMKFDSGGNLGFSKVFGGNGAVFGSDTYANSIAVDPDSGNVFIAGETWARDFPSTAGSYNQIHNDALRGSDGFVVKMNSAGGVIYSTFLGGTTSTPIYYTPHAYIYESAFSGIKDPNGANLASMVYNWLQFSGYISAGQLQNFDGVTPINYYPVANFYLTPEQKQEVFNILLGYYRHYNDGRNDKINAITAYQDCAYIVGSSYSYNFPRTSGAYNNNLNPNEYRKPFAAKLNSAGTSLDYSTWLSDPNADADGLDSSPYDIKVDASGNAYICGLVITYPSMGHGFPTTSNAMYKTPVYTEYVTKPDCPFGIYYVYEKYYLKYYDLYGDYGCGFVTKLSPSGSSLLYSSFLPCGSVDQIEVDSSGNMFLKTRAVASNLAVTNLRRFYTGSGYSVNSDYILKVDPAGSQVISGLYFGGNGNFYSMAFDSTYRNIFVTGVTGLAYTTYGRLATDGAFQTTLNGTYDAYVAKISPGPNAPTDFAIGVTSNSFNYYWTDNSSDEAGFKILDQSGNVKVTTLANAVRATETGLSVNTSYIRKVQAYNTDGTSESSSVTKYTLANIPGSPTISGASPAVSITFSTNGNPSATLYAVTADNGASWIQSNGSTGEVIYWASSSNGSSGWKYNVAANAQYTIRAKAKNGDGIETSLSGGTVSDGNGGQVGGQNSNLNLVYVSGCTSSIDTTNGINFILSLDTNSNPAGTYYAISPDNGSTWLQADGTAAASAYWATSSSGWGYYHLSPNTTYTFNAKAKNTLIETAFGYSTSFTTMANTPSVESGTSNWNFADGYYIQINLNASSNPAGTYFAVSSDYGTSWLQADGTTSTTIYWSTSTSGWTYKNLSPNTSYNLRAKAKNKDETETNLSYAQTIITTVTSTLEGAITDIFSGSAVQNAVVSMAGSVSTTDAGGIYSVTTSTASTFAVSILQSNYVAATDTATLVPYQTSIINKALTPALKNISATSEAARIKITNAKQIWSTANYYTDLTRVVTGNTSWTSSNTNIATIETAGTNEAFVKGVGLGTATIEGSYQGKTDRFTVNIVPQTGSLFVSTNSNVAAFSIAGPVNYSGRGTSWSTSETPVGVYTVNFGALAAGYTITNITAGTQALLPYQTITFEASYASTPPTINSVTPSSGAVSEVVTIEGANFGNTQLFGNVKVNNQNATIVSWSNTKIVINVPSIGSVDFPKTVTLHVIIKRDASGTEWQSNAPTFIVTKPFIFEHNPVTYAVPNITIEVTGVYKGFVSPGSDSALYYKTPAGNYKEIKMTSTGPSTYAILSAKIPSSAVSGALEYYLIIKDQYNNSLRFPESGTYEINLSSNTGTVEVTTNLAAAAFILKSSQNTYTGSGISWKTSNIPVASYTLTFNPANNYDTPSSRIGALDANQTLQFSGIYIRQTGSIQVKISGLATGNAVSFSLSGPLNISGQTQLNEVWSTTEAYSGTYIVSYEAKSGYTSPSNQTRILVKNGTLIFEGVYTAPVQQSVILPSEWSNSQNIINAYAQPFLVTSESVSFVKEVTLRLKKRNGDTAKVYLAKNIGNNTVDTAVQKMSEDKYISLSGNNEYYTIPFNTNLGTAGTYFIVVEIQPNPPALGYPVLEWYFASASSGNTAYKKNVNTWKITSPPVELYSNIIFGTAPNPVGTLSLFVIPITNTVTPAASASYSVSVEATNGYVGTYMLGTNLGFNRNITAAFSTPEITAPGRATLTVFAGQSASSGTITFQVNALGAKGATSETATLTVTKGSPNILQVNPQTVSAGTIITIYGLNFGTTQGTSEIKINDASIGSAQSWADGIIKIKIPDIFDLTSSSTLKIIVNGATSNTFTLTKGFYLTSADYALAGSMWPMYQHDNQHSGKGSYNSITSRPVTKWTFSAGSAVSASPVIGPEGTVYVASEGGKVFAIDKNRGIKKWEFNAGSPVYAAPAVTKNGNLIIASDRIYSLTTQEGQQVFVSEPLGQIKHSPVIGSDGAIYLITSQGHIYGLNYNGSVRFHMVPRQATQEGQSISSTHPIIDNDGNIIFTLNDVGNAVPGRVIRLNSRGEQVFQNSYSNEIGTIGINTGGASAMALPYGTYTPKNLTLDSNGNYFGVYSSATSARISSLRESSQGTVPIQLVENQTSRQINCSQAWSVEIGSSKQSPARASDETIYIGRYTTSTPEIISIDPNNGNINWSFSSPYLPNTPIAIAAASPTTLYYGTENGKLYSLSSIGVSSTLTINISTVTLEAGQTQQFTAKVYDQYGNELTARTISWSAGGGFIDSTGFYTAGSNPGWFTITASYDGIISTSRVNIPGNVPADQKKITLISLSPSSSTMNNGSSQQFSALGYYQDLTYAGDITQSSTWETSGGGTFSSTSKGLFTASEAGSFEIRATYVNAQAETIVGSTKLGITSSQPSIARIALNFGTYTLPEGGSVQFSATAYDLNGNTITYNNFTWSTTGGGTINPSTGLFTANSNITSSSETYTVYASADGVLGRAYITIIKTQSNRTLTSISLSPNPASVIVDESVTFEAIGKDQYGTQMSGLTFTFSTNGGGTINSSGVYSATQTGRYKVYAVSLGITGEAEVIVSQRSTQSVKSIIISSGSSVLNVGDSQQFTATAYDQNQNLVPNISFSWLTSGGGSITNTGYFTAGAAGTYTVIASHEGISGTMLVTIKGNLSSQTGPVTSITVTNNPGSLTTGQTYQFIALAYDASGNPVSDSFVWAVTGGGTIDQNGNFTATQEGTYSLIITASNGVINSTQFTVVSAGTTAGTVTSIAIQPTSASIIIGNTVQFYAIAYDANHVSKSGVTFQWSTSGGGTINNSGLFSSTTKGSFTIYAAAEGVISTASIVVGSRESTGQLSYIVITPTPASGSSITFNVGDTLQLVGTGYDANGNQIPVSFTWSASGGGSIGQNGYFVAQTPGNYSITATYNNQSASVSITIIGTQTSSTGEATSIAVDPDSISINVNESIQFSAIAKDKNGYLVPNLSFTWSVTGGGTINSNGYFVAQTAGKYQIRANYGNLIGSALVTINPANTPNSGNLTTIIVSPGRVSVPVGKNITFTAYGKDATNYILSNLTFNWTVSGGGTITSNGVFTATTVGNYTATAAYGDVYGLADLNIVTDSQGPEIILTVDDKSVAQGSYISRTPTIKVNLDDDSGINLSTIKLYLDNSAFENSELLVNEKSTTKSHQISKNISVANSLSPGKHSIKITGQDIYGNSSELLADDLQVEAGELASIGVPINYPNPFKPARGQGTYITYTLNQNADITLMIYDITGILLYKRIFLSGVLGGTAGINEVYWNGISDFGQVIGNSAYQYVIIGNNKVLARGSMAVYQ